MYSKQVITNVFFTKEAIEDHYKTLQKQQAERFGMSIDEYLDAVRNGKVVTLKNEEGQDIPNTFSS